MPHFDPDHSLASSPGAGMLHWCDFEPRRWSHGLWVGAGLHPTSHSSVGCQNPCAAGLQRIKNQFILGIPKFTSQSVASHYARRSKDSLTPTSFGLNVKQRECTRIQTQRYCGCFETILVTVVTRHAASAQHLLTCQAFGTDHSNTRQDLGDYIQAPLWLFGWGYLLCIKAESIKMLTWSLKTEWRNWN